MRSKIIGALKLNARTIVLYTKRPPPVSGTFTIHGSRSTRWLELLFELVPRSLYANCIYYSCLPRTEIFPPVGGWCSKAASLISVKKARKEISWILMLRREIAVKKAEERYFLVTLWISRYTIISNLFTFYYYLSISLLSLLDCQAKA